MKKTPPKNDLIGDFLRQHPNPEVDFFVEHCLDIADRIQELLDKKGWSQRDLAKAVGKTEAEVSRWLSGGHNLTVRTLAKISAAFGESLLTTTPKKATPIVRYVAFKVHQTGPPASKKQKGKKTEKNSELLIA